MIKKINQLKKLKENLQNYNDNNRKGMNYNLIGLLLFDNRLNISQKCKRIIRFQKYYSIDLHNLCCCGDLNGIKWKNKYKYQFATDAIDYAAEEGHLEVVKWLHYNRSEGFTVNAMDQAAGRGYLEVVKWLHYNRSEGCTYFAMDQAAYKGHLEVIKWLHDNRSEGCSDIAINYAALRGHLEVVKWLLANKKNKCKGTRYALINAKKKGYTEIVKLLEDTFS